MVNCGSAERVVVDVERLARVTARDRGGSSERYIDRHQFRFRTHSRRSTGTYSSPSVPV